MRRTRRVFLLLLACLFAAVGVTYYKQRLKAASEAPVAPAALDQNTRIFNQDWVYYKGERDCPELELRAREAEGVEQPKAKMMLRGMQLRIYHSCGKTFDLIQSASADFDESEGRMYADGEVDITLGKRSEEDGGQLVSVKTSGLDLDIKSAKARTDRHARFVFEKGEGEATGAEYDPHARELLMRSAVSLTWRGDGKGPVMKMAAARLLHRETEKKVYLNAPTRFARQTLTLDAGDAVVTLDKGAIRQVEAQKATGVDERTGRKLGFGANELHMELSAKSEVEKITGAGDARLTTTTASGETDVKTERIFLTFEPVDNESVLRTAQALGKTLLESKPSESNKAKPATRVVRAEGVLTKMRDNGEEIESVETTTPGEVELLPNRPDQPKRWMRADRLWMDYGTRNQVSEMRAVKVETRTIKPKPASGPASGKEKAVEPALTWSEGLKAAFHPESGEMTTMEQWDNFRYKEGEREATAARATLESSTNLITLDKSARAWDPSGSVSASQIVMNEKTGDYTAVGDVSSTRMPDEKPAAKPGSVMLARDKPMQAKAAKMVSTAGNKHIVYEGNAVLWQDANRLQGDRVVIDRDKRKVQAEGKVVSQFLDRRPNAKTKQQTFTVVRAPWLEYTDTDRVAYYRGGVRLIREGMDVKSKELRAWMAEDKAGDSSLHHAFADGDVEIFQQQLGRTRIGSSEHAEYYVADEKVILAGGNPQMTDSLKGITRGKRLTYFAGNDSFQVEGAPVQPVVSIIRRKGAASQ